MFYIDTRRQFHFQLQGDEKIKLLTAGFDRISGNLHFTVGNYMVKLTGLKVISTKFEKKISSLNRY